MTRALWCELLAVTVLAAAAVASIPLVDGKWGWSWDALNHHIYLGLISESPRWHLDVNAASVQSWQYPYLYWPIYRLSLLPIEGATAGALWSAFSTAMLVPPVWVACRHLLPAHEGAVQAVFERTAACVLALCSLVVLSAVGTTANDSLAAVPLLWAVALMAAPNASDRRAGAAAALWGVSCAFKLSNGLALPLLLVWWWQRPGGPFPLRRGLWLSVGALAGFVLAYAPWGWPLWQQTGNPFYPFFRRFFGE